MIYPVNFVGVTGLVKDQSKYDAPPEMWTDCRNVQFSLGLVEKAPFWQPGSSVTPATFGLFFARGNQKYWVLCGADKVYSLQGTSETEITRLVGGNYTGNSFSFWSGGMFNGILVLNNGVDVPQSWNLPAGAARLTDLPNWQSGVRAAIIRPFKNYLFALDVTKAGLRDRRLVKWSHTASPLTIPTSWDEADPTKDAGENTLSEGEDAIIDGVASGDYFAIGTEKQTWAVRFVGGQPVFAFRRVFGDVGLLAPGCFLPFSGGLFQVTAEDLIVHDFQNVNSTTPDRIRKWFFGRLTESNFQRVRTVSNRMQKEIWVCFPDGGSPYLNMALVWNWQFNTWAIREVPPCLTLAEGAPVPTPSTQTWTTVATTWAAASEPWDATDFSVAKDTLALVDTNNRLQTLSASVTSSDTSYSFIERTGLAAKPGQQGIALSHNVLGIHLALWPKIEAPVGTQFRITIGFQMEREGVINWQPAKIFTAGVDKAVGCLGTYRYLALRIEALTPGRAWKLAGYDLDIETGGKF